MADLPGRPSRRNFLKAGAVTATIAGLPLSAKAETKPEPVPLDQYQPVYFTKPEWDFVVAASDRLIPADGKGPGALECRVPVFIDRQMLTEFGSGSNWYMEGPHDPSAADNFGYQTPLSPAQLYRAAIPLVDAWCRENLGARFAELSNDNKDEALHALEGTGKVKMGLAPEFKEFFGILLGNAKEGYFSDPMYGGNYKMKAWVYVGFPGARASYLEWVHRRGVKYPLGPVSISGERA